MKSIVGEHDEGELRVQMDVWRGGYMNQAWGGRRGMCSQSKHEELEEKKKERESLLVPFA